jgi:hypothetical protein
MARPLGAVPRPDGRSARPRVCRPTPWQLHEALANATRGLRSRRLSPAPRRRRFAERCVRDQDDLHGDRYQPDTQKVHLPATAKRHHHKDVRSGRRRVLKRPLAPHPVMDPEDKHPSACGARTPSQADPPRSSRRRSTTAADCLPRTPFRTPVKATTEFIHTVAPKSCLIWQRRTGSRRDRPAVRGRPVVGQERDPAPWPTIATALVSEC